MQFLSQIIQRPESLKVAADPGIMDLARMSPQERQAMANVFDAMQMRDEAEDEAVKSRNMHTGAAEGHASGRTGMYIGGGLGALISAIAAAKTGKFSPGIAGATTLGGALLGSRLGSSDVVSGFANQANHYESEADKHQETLEGYLRNRQLARLFPQSPAANRRLPA